MDEKRRRQFRKTSEGHVVLPGVLHMQASTMTTSQMARLGQGWRHIRPDGDTIPTSCRGNKKGD
jgi:hypothetical protein